MKVILNQDVYNLGEEGDVCEVAKGYARNYLIPQGYAVLYNKQSVALFESRKAAIEKRKEEKRKESLSLKEKIQEQEIVLEVPSGDNGKLFGSVTNANVAEALKALGITVERKKIELPEHNIKALGTYTAKIKLYGDESAELKVIIKSDKEESAAPAEKKAKAEVPVKEEKEENEESPAVEEVPEEKVEETAPEAEAEKTEETEEQEQ